MNVKDTLPYVNDRINQIAKFCHADQAKDELEHGELNPLRALVLRAIIATPGLPDFLYDQRVVRPYERGGYAVVGAGMHTTAIQDGPHAVRKIHENSLHLSESEQYELIDHLESRQALTAHHLGRYCLSQTYAIDQHPLRPNKSVVVATQPFISAMRSINFFQRADSQQTELAGFAKKCHNMYANSNYEALPDLAGNNNVLIDAETRTPLLIDPIALLRADPSDNRAYEKTATILKTSLPR